MKPIIMPVMGQDFETGKIVQWVKKENDTVKKGEVILITESEKTSFEIEAEEDGVMLKILYPEGAEVEVLKPIGYIGQDEEEYKEGQTDSSEEAQTSPPVSIQEIEPSAFDRGTSAEEKRLMASPSVKRFAKEVGVDISQVTGSGPDGRIMKSDVLEAAQNNS